MPFAVGSFQIALHQLTERTQRTGYTASVGVKVSAALLRICHNVIEPNGTPLTYVAVSDIEHVFAFDIYVKRIVPNIGLFVISEIQTRIIIRFVVRSFAMFGYGSGIRIVVIFIPTESHRRQVRCV